MPVSIDGTRGIIFSDCPAVCAYVRVCIRAKAFPTGWLDVDSSCLRCERFRNENLLSATCAIFSVLLLSLVANANALGKIRFVCFAVIFIAFV